MPQPGHLKPVMYRKQQGMEKPVRRFKITYPKTAAPAIKKPLVLAGTVNCILHQGVAYYAETEDTKYKIKNSR